MNQTGNKVHINVATERVIYGDCLSNEYKYTSLRTHILLSSNIRLWSLNKTFLPFIIIWYIYDNSSNLGGEPG
jgi:hypothetical protein